MHRSHGDGTVDRARFRRIGTNVIFEVGSLVFHPENIELGDNIYVGHYAILKGYHKNTMRIGDGTWIGQQCFIHSAGGVTIGRDVGIAPHVRILTSAHEETPRGTPVMHGPLTFAPVALEDGCDVGIGAVILPGVTIGAGAIVGAGAVVTRSVAPFSVVAGVPACFVRMRDD
ncbi:MAG: transferase [Deltaproteobacteria bacterium]|nr:transferase [Deltaproteobacteria bacterium]